MAVTIVAREEHSSELLEPAGSAVIRINQVIKLDGTACEGSRHSSECFFIFTIKLEELSNLRQVRGSQQVPDRGVVKATTSEGHSCDCEIGQIWKLLNYYDRTRKIIRRFTLRSRHLQAMD